jgi:arginyl-tRNA synthetase
MADFRELIAATIESALEGKMKKAEIAALLETPPSPKMGDYAFPCFRLAADFKKSPTAVAVELAEKIFLPDGIAGMNPEGPYLNFFAAKDLIAQDTIGRILEEGDSYGQSKTGKGQKVLVEYSAPNSNKPLHLGHLRNSSIGMAIFGILGASGFKVTRANLVNDRGIHICKSMLTYMLFGNNDTPEKAKEKPDHFVGKYYLMYNRMVKEQPELEKKAYALLGQWEKGNGEAIDLWKKMTAWAVKGFKETYKEFGSVFEQWFFESQFYDKAKPILALGEKKGLFVKNEEGTLVAKLEAEGLPDKAVLRADGTSIYITNDLALTKHKFEKFKLDRCFWVVGNEQDLFFRQLFKIFELLGFEWAKKCMHLSHGMVNLPSGKLKSREGIVVDADEIIAEMEGLAAEEIKKRSPKMAPKEIAARGRAIGLAAIKFHMLRVAIQKDILFNPKESISFEGETGPYVQYAHARAKSILEKAGKTKGQKVGFERLIGPEEQKLLKLLASYPEAVKKSLEQLSPHVICQFLIETAEDFNTFYHKHKVLQAGTEEIKNERIALVKATAQVLKNGLKLLDIEPIEKM